MSATPRPWTVERHDQDDGSINYEIWTNGWVLIATYHRVVTLSDADNERAREDAALIVRAVNAHDDLVAALKAAMDHIGNGYQPPDLIEQANAALAKAEAP